MKKKQTVGNIFKITLCDNVYCYGRLIHMGLFSFYDLFTDQVLTVEEITSRPVLFSVYVHKYVYTKSTWTVVGYKELVSSEESSYPLFFRQDILDYKKCWVRNIKGEEYLASPEECINLERAAVWDYFHVEDRLRNIYIKKPDLTTEFLKVKLE